MTITPIPTERYTFRMMVSERKSLDAQVKKNRTDRSTLLRAMIRRLEGMEFYDDELEPLVVGRAAQLLGTATKAKTERYTFRMKVSELKELDYARRCLGTDRQTLIRALIHRIKGQKFKRDDLIPLPVGMAAAGSRVASRNGKIGMASRWHGKKAKKNARNGMKMTAKKKTSKKKSKKKSRRR